MPMISTRPKQYGMGAIPRPMEMREYLSWIEAVRDILPMDVAAPPVPADMDHLTYREANDIERILYLVDQGIDRIKNSWIYSGEFEAGGI